MKRLIATSLAIVAVAGLVAASPALGQPERKTELVELGESVDTLLLRYGFEATWVVDNQNILLRDTYRDHYVVTLKEACEQLDLQRSFKFFPALSGHVRTGRIYEVRNPSGPPCDIARIEQIDDARAVELRAAVAAKS